MSPAQKFSQKLDSCSARGCTALTTSPENYSPPQKKKYSPWGCICTQCTPWLRLCKRVKNNARSVSEVFIKRECNWQRLTTQLRTQSSRQETAIVPANPADRRRNKSFYWEAKKAEKTEIDTTGLIIR